MVQDVEPATHPSFWPYADMIVLAASHERSALADSIDQVSFVRRIPWLPVWSSPTEIQCGPLVDPGRTACYQCFVRRRNQHAAARREIKPDGATHPTGYPDHHVGIAVAFARQAINEAFSGNSKGLGGTVRRFDQINGITSRASVARAHRCSRCSPPSLAGGEIWNELELAKRGEGNE